MIIMKKVLKVFTKEYKEEIKEYEFMQKQLKRMKLSSDNYDVEEVIRLLKENDPTDNQEMQNNDSLENSSHSLIKK